MSGLSEGQVPVALTLHGRSRELELSYADGTAYRIPFELMRVCSPSAEVRGHGPGQEVLVTGKARVTIESLEPVGRYAVRPRFSDGHDSGLFTWAFLRELGERREQLWADYERRLALAGGSREPPVMPGSD